MAISLRDYITVSSKQCLVTANNIRAMVLAGTFSTMGGVEAAVYIADLLTESANREIKENGLASHTVEYVQDA